MLPARAPCRPLALLCLGLAGCGLPEFFDRLTSAPGGVVAARPPENIPPLDQTEAEAQVVALINEARATSRSCGAMGSFAPAPPLTAESRLGLAARGHSTDMAQKNYFAHQAPDGSQPWDRVDEQRYLWQAVGENIAAGQATPAEAVAAWLDSPGHCVNIMNPKFSQTGVGQAAGGKYRVYWTQVFAHPR